MIVRVTVTALRRGGVEGDVQVRREPGEQALDEGIVDMRRVQDHAFPALLWLAARGVTGEMWLPMGPAEEWAP